MFIQRQRPSDSNDLFESLLGIPILASQVYRVNNVPGHQIEQDLHQDVGHPDLTGDEVALFRASLPPDHAYFGLLPCSRTRG